MFIPVSEPNLLGNEREYVNRAIESTWISSNGDYIERFEDMFSQYLNIKYSITVSNGTVALHLALLALGIGEGDEVIVPNLTYIATANAVNYTGATPVFADSKEDTWNIDPESIKRLISKKTKAIIPVHLYGTPCNMDEILNIAKENDLYVIEDAAEALGSEYKNKKIGTFGDIATFSFYGNKTITTGEGGMVVTNKQEIADKIKLLKGQGMDSQKRYWFNVVGYNYRMTNMQAAVGCAQMERVNDLVEAKVRNAKLYNFYLEDIIDKIAIPYDNESIKNAYWMYSIILKGYGENKRERFREKLKSTGIETRPFFYLMSDMPPYSEFKKDKSKVAQKLADSGINLPSSTLLSEKDIKLVAFEVKKCLNEL